MTGVLDHPGAVVRAPVDSVPASATGPAPDGANPRPGRWRRGRHATRPGGDGVDPLLADPRPGPAAARRSGWGQVGDLDQAAAAAARHQAAAARGPRAGADGA